MQITPLSTSGTVRRSNWYVNTCGKRNPQYRANTSQSTQIVIDQVDLTERPEAETPTGMKETPPRPAPRLRAEAAVPRAMITHPPEYVHGEGERQRQESIRLLPSKKSKPTVVEPTYQLVLSVHRRIGEEWVNQPVSRLVTVPNNEYDYLLLVQTSINKLRTASRPAERSWLVGDLKDWQIATQPHQGRLIPPTTVFYEGKHRLSYLLTTEWGLQANKGAGKQYRLYLYYSIDGSALKRFVRLPPSLSPRLRRVRRVATWLSRGMTQITWRSLRR
jgi:hypothetical protein